MTDTQEDPEVIASTIRKEIFETTGCKASAGIAGNLLMARLATRSAKPDGQCYIPPDKVLAKLLSLKMCSGKDHKVKNRSSKMFYNSRVFLSLLPHFQLIEL